MRLNLSLTDFVRRWIVARKKLIAQLEKVQAENVELRAKVTGLQHARDQADRSAEERRREKEVLREKVAEQRKALEATQLVHEQVTAMLSELRDENERLRQSRGS